MMILIRFFKRIGSVIFNNCKEFVGIFLNNSFFKSKVCPFKGCGTVDPLGGVVAGKENNNKNNMIINIISYTFLSIIFYLFMWDFKIFKILQIFIFSIFSFAISMFISDKFKLSNNKFIKILQKFVFINSILALIALFLYLFDVSIFNTVFCEDGSEDEVENEADSLKNKDKDVARVTTNVDDKNEEYYSFKVKKAVIDNALERGKELFMGGVKDIAPNLGIGAAAGKAAAEAFKHTGTLTPAPRPGSRAGDRID